MIVAICGGLGSGKTLLLTRYAHKEYLKAKKIYSNYNLKFKHDKIDLPSLLELKPELENSGIFIDELYIYMDSRLSGSKRNRMLSYFVFQTRKLGVTLFFTSQHIGQVDIRLRNMLDILCLCKQTIKKDWFKVDIIDYREFPDVNSSTFIYNGSAYYPLYDTLELVTFDE